MLTLNEIKNYLDRTWDDEASDNKLRSIALRAQAAVLGLIGAENVQFVDLSGMTPEGTSEGSEEEQLFLDACRYIASDAFEDFRTNFADNIISLRIKHSLINEKTETEAE